MKVARDISLWDRGEYGTQSISTLPIKLLLQKFYYLYRNDCHCNMVGKRWLELLRLGTLWKPCHWNCWRLRNQIILPWFLTQINYWRLQGGTSRGNKSLNDSVASSKIETPSSRKGLCDRFVEDCVARRGSSKIFSIKHV